MTETKSILRGLLYEASECKTREDILDAIRSFCMEDDIAAVEKRLADARERRAAEKKD